MVLPPKITAETRRGLSLYMAFLLMLISSFPADEK
jgi:hypothetical protein